MDFEFPTETIDLPTKGWFYPESSPLSSGQIELNYMTAKHENILASKNLLVKGTAIDKLLEELIATKGVKLDDLLLGDKNAIFVAARILGYGKDYDAKVTCPACENDVDTTINLQDLGEVTFDFEKFPKGVNEFEYTLPVAQVPITFKMLTSGDEKIINKDLQQTRKLASTGVDTEITTRMRRAVVSVNGERDRSVVNKFVDNMLAIDARAFREYARDIMPNVDFSFDFECSECGHNEKVEVPIDHTFFWPKSRVPTRNI